MAILLSRSASSFGAVFHLAELFLNRLHLLVQVVLALALLHLLLDAAADALLDVQDVDLALDDAEDLFQADLDVANLEDALFFGKLQGHVGRDRVGKSARLVDA